MITYGDFSEGDPVCVVEQYTDRREPDGAVRQITGNGQIVSEDGRRFKKEESTFVRLFVRENRQGGVREFSPG